MAMQASWQDKNYFYAKIEQNPNAPPGSAAAYLYAFRRHIYCPPFLTFGTLLVIELDNDTSGTATVQSWRVVDPPSSAQDVEGTVTSLRYYKYGVRGVYNMFIPAPRGDSNLQKYLHSLADQKVLFSTTQTGMYIGDVKPSFPQARLNMHQGHFIWDIPGQMWCVWNTQKGFGLLLTTKAAARYKALTGNEMIQGRNVRYLEFKHNEVLYADYLRDEGDQRDLKLVGLVDKMHSSLGKEVGLQLRLSFVSLADARSIDDRSLHYKYSIPPGVVFTDSQGAVQRRSVGAGTWFDVFFTHEGQVREFRFLTRHATVKSADRIEAKTKVQRRVREQSIF